MEIINSILNFVLIYLIVSGILNFFAFTRARKAVEHANKEHLELKPELKDEVEMVRDNICGRTLPKSEAYILAKDGIRHYFCSWDCREKFIAGNQM